MEGDLQKNTSTKIDLKGAIQQLIQSLECCCNNDIIAVNNADWLKLFNLLGKKVIHKDMWSDGNDLCKLYREPKYLKEIDTQKFIQQRNDKLNSFLEGLSGLDFSSQLSETKSYNIACTIEHIYRLLNFNWILPYNFLLNLMESFVSGSKLVTTLNGKIYGGGGYKTYVDWLNARGESALPCPKGDIVTFIDNIGRYIVKKISRFCSKKMMHLKS